MKPSINIISLNGLSDAIKNSDSDVIIVLPESCNETERNKLVESATKKFNELSEIASYEKPLIKRKRPRITGTAKLY